MTNDCANCESTAKAVLDTLCDSVYAEKQCSCGVLWWMAKGDRFVRSNAKLDRWFDPSVGLVMKGQDR